MSEFIDDVQTRIISALVRLGVGEEVAGMVGVEIVTGISRDWSGDNVYISRDAERARMRDEVRRRFNGRNAREIARELGIGRATVYRIIKTPAR